MGPGELLQARVDFVRQWSGVEPTFLPVTEAEYTAYERALKDAFLFPHSAPVELPHELRFNGIPLKKVSFQDKQ